MGTKFKNFLALLTIIGGLVAVVILADALGAWDIYRAQQQTRAAEAQARALEAQANVLRERQADLSGVKSLSGALRIIIREWQQHQETRHASSNPTQQEPAPAM